jgi:transposase, IS5 family
VRGRARAINANRRRRNDDKLSEVRRINAELADIAVRVASRADAVVRNARRALPIQARRASGRARALVERLTQIAERTRKVAAQTHQRLAGETPEGVDSDRVPARW